MRAASGGAANENTARAAWDNPPAYCLRHTAPETALIARSNALVPDLQIRVATALPARSSFAIWPLNWK